MAPRLETPQEVRRYLTEIFGSEREYSIFPTEFAWVVRPVRTAAESADGLGHGAGNYVVDRATGVITTAGSLAPAMIAEDYDAGIRAGRPIAGYQIYPPTWDIRAELVEDGPDRVRYRVRGRSLQEPPAGPPIDHMLTIDRQTLDYRTDVGEIHPVVTNMVIWAFERYRQTGTWPAAAELRA
ncbi:hypothetical protein [Nocardia carnea]|uniref:hypothetical protein n=1 Tax=Nocardia carnea TaxID=37328 RepID=UPI002454B731|nr:hypothetical protein [Nocardia carnea]